jgi:hypothetical protein
MHSLSGPDDAPCICAPIAPGGASAWTPSRCAWRAGRDRPS